MSHGVKVVIKNKNFAEKELDRMVSGAVSMDAGYLEGSTYIDGSSVAAIAALNEYGYREGNKYVPARPAMRDTIRLKKEDWDKKISLFMCATKNTEKSLKLLGEIVVSDIKEVIKAGDFVPNAPSTVKKKGFNAPLQDTGIRQQATAYRINTNVKPR